MLQIFICPHRVIVTSTNYKQEGYCILYPTTRHKVYLLLSIVSQLVVAHYNTDSEHKFLGIVIIENAVQIISKSRVDLLRNLLHRQFFICKDKFY